MKSLNRNQLAEIITEDGQPVRAITNYLTDTFDYLEGFDCITDYYSKHKGDPLDISNHPANKPNLKMTKELYIEFLEASIDLIKDGLKQN